MASEMFSQHRQLRHDALGLAVLAQEADAGADGGSRATRRAALALDADRPAARRIDAEDGARRLGAAGPEQPRQAHDLAPPDDEVEPAQPAIGGDALSFDQHLAGASAAAAAADLRHAGSADLLDVAAQHVGDQRQLAGGVDRRPGHGPAVAHDRHAIADAKQLVEKMRDVEHGRAAPLEFADDPEQHLDLALVE